MSTIGSMKWNPENFDATEYFKNRLPPTKPCPGGTFYNVPNKVYVRCDTCHRVSYEHNEGDLHVE